MDNILYMAIRKKTVNYTMQMEIFTYDRQKMNKSEQTNKKVNIGIIDNQSSGIFLSECKITVTKTMSRLYWLNIHFHNKVEIPFMLCAIDHLGPISM